MSPAERSDFLRRMRRPLLAFGLLTGLLALNVALGALVTAPHIWMVQLGVALLMLVTVMILSMDVLHEPPLMRLFAVLGFCWAGILFAMTLIDYLTR